MTGKWWAEGKPSWDEVMLAQAIMWSRRANCPRLHAGIVFANDDHQTISSGYNGALAGMPECDEVGCLMVDGHCLRTLHAEENAISFAARSNRSLIGCTAYISARPCQKCTKLMIQNGVKKILFWKPYNTDQVDDQVERMLKYAGVPILGPLKSEYPIERLFSVDRVHE